MAENLFVDLQKRAIGLANGCKDLIDVLRPTASAAGSFPPLVGTAGDILAQVRTFFQGSHRPKALMICDPFCLIVRLRSTRDGIEAAVEIQGNGWAAELNRERGVRAVLEDHGVVLTRDFVVSGYCELRFIPSDDPVAVSNLITGVFGRNCDALEKVRIGFHYAEGPKSRIVGIEGSFVLPGICAD